MGILLRRSDGQGRRVRARPAGVVAGLALVLTAGCSERPAPRPSASRPATKRATGATGAATTTRPTGTALATLRRAFNKGMIDQTRVTLVQVSMALERFYLQMGRYPTEEEGLRALRVKLAFDDEALAAKWAGPYLNADPKDAWGHDVNYALLEGGDTEAGVGAYKLWSLGPDGQSGTEDDIVHTIAP